MAITAPKIAVVVCSSRQPRCNPQIADFVLNTIKSTYAESNGNTVPTLTIIDLAERNLPFLDEPDVPSQVTDPSKYVHEHTRKWSAEVSSYDAFIFVTPQYNWGYPAVLKNAIDYLYNEWKGKAAMVVSYGGHGGGKANAQLRQILGAVNMFTTKKNVELSFPGKEFLKKAAYGKELELDGADEKAPVWGKERKEIIEAFGELMELVGAGGISKTFKSAGMTLGYVKDELFKRFGKQPAESAPRREKSEAGEAKQ